MKDIAGLKDRAFQKTKPYYRADSSTFTQHNIQPKALAQEGETPCYQQKSST